MGAGERTEKCTTRDIPIGIDLGLRRDGLLLAEPGPTVTRRSRLPLIAPHQAEVHLKGYRAPERARSQ